MIKKLIWLFIIVTCLGFAIWYLGFIVYGCGQTAEELPATTNTTTITTPTTITTTVSSTTTTSIKETTTSSTTTTTASIKETTASSTTTTTASIEETTTSSTTSSTTTTLDISPPLLFSPIYDTAEATHIGSRFWAPPSKPGEGYHSGIDIVFKRAEGGRVKSSISGEVTSITTASSHADPTIDIFITHNSKYKIMHCFEPLEERYVEVGDQVQAGQLLGKVGSWETGDYGPVLHFEVDAYGSPECPMMFLNQEARQQFRALYNLNSIEGLVDPCYQHPQGCPSLHY